MPKLGMGPIRRRQLVDAAILSIHEYGLAEATVARIARKAGVSSGIVHHYFSDKDDLLAATMRRMLQALRDETVLRLARAATPRQRCQAVIDACLADSQYSPELMTAWLALYGSARHSPVLARILDVYYRRLRSNLVNGLKPLTGAEDAAAIADGIAALIDGLWLRQALTDRRAGAPEARLMVHEYLDMSLEKKTGN